MLESQVAKIGGGDAIGVETRGGEGVCAGCGFEDSGDFAAGEAVAGGVAHFRAYACGV